ncbi:hypothetical protein AGOR_G00150820 [Albula goreensis]|uniref:Fibronectin type-III domain-containing protein n=1 Tax=Albula goreensis TaxID=1534307 RepID=A0A8T3D3E4_9TELE|nr:hypothetical protein AGOR_G00150820 [Albula goreensis]
MTIKDPCTGKKSIHINKTEIESRTTSADPGTTKLFAKVANITGSSVLACRCITASNNPDICGIDLSAGYPPLQPQNLKCVQKGENGNVTCSWEKGRETRLSTSWELWVRTIAPNGAVEVRSIPGNGSANFSVSQPQAQYFVWINESNSLGSVVSKLLSFSLSDIAMPLPPVIRELECSARRCALHWDRRQGPLLMQIRHRETQGNWTTRQFTANSNSTWDITDLQPFTEYEVQARCKRIPERGIWSDWSVSLTTWTDEEVPLKKLDIWYSKTLSQSQSGSFNIFWKEPGKSEAGGRIMGYKLEVDDELKGNNTQYLSYSSACWEITCTRCTVTLSVYNSKGHSPPASMTLPLLEDPALAPQNIRWEKHSDSSIAISWRQPATAEVVKGYLVEWYPANRKQQGFMWKRVHQKITAHNQLKTVIRENIQPTECYQGGVYALYERKIGKKSFTGVSTVDAVPTQGPILTTVKAEDGRVTLTWTAIPWEHQRGCLKKYTIYLERTRDKNIQIFGLMAPYKTNHSISPDLQPGEKYNLSMTGWTSAGEGQRSSTWPFFYPHQADQQIALVLAFGICTFIVCLVFMSLCHIPSVRQRVSSCCFCLMPDIIPDPANSKWAKECVGAKGEVILDHQLYLGDSSLSEEPLTVEVQEFQKSWTSQDPCRMSPPSVDTDDLHLLLQPSRSPQAISPLYQGQLTCSYIKSFSHESDSSEQTQESRSTDVTVDYISSHGMLGDGGDTAAEDECLEDFFPCPQSPFLDALFPCGGKLTLDAVKIDCSFLD